MISVGSLVVLKVGNKEIEGLVIKMIKNSIPIVDFGSLGKIPVIPTPGTLREVI